MPDLGYRPLGLESDVDNKNFTGAVNPDSLLHVEFYWHTPLDRNKTDENFEATGKLQRIYGVKRPYIRIQKPGDPRSIIEAEVREDHKRRWPEKWLYFQIQEGLIDAGQNQPGWKIEQWEELTQDELHKLKFERFYTVEQIAGASDSQVMGIGMGGLGLRKRAQEALSQRIGAQVKKDMEAKDALIADLAARLAKIEGSLAAPQSASPTPPPQSAELAVAAGKPARTMSPEHKEKMRRGREAALAKKQAKGA